MGDMDKVVMYAFGFLIVAVVIVAAFLALDDLAPQVACSSGTWNASANSCWNGTANNAALLTSAGNATLKVSEGMFNSVEMAPTWGTMIGVTVLVAIVLGMGLAGYGYAKNKGLI